MEVDKQPIWTPTEDDLQQSSMAKFRDFCNTNYNLRLTSYHELHAWSVSPKTAADFWMALFQFLDLGATVQPSQTFPQPSPNMFPSPAFFPDARLNFAASILLHRDPAAVALLEVREGALDATPVTWGALHAEVARLADAMRASGVFQGDRVVAVIANTELAIALCLAVLSMGAIWSSISPDFGAQGILDRLLQVRPKLVFAVTEVLYSGKRRDLVPTVVEWANVVARVEGLVDVVCVGELRGREREIGKGVRFEDFLSRGTGRGLVFEQLPFGQPAFIVYSSGTTGAPKCIVHSAGGVLMQIKKDYMLHVGVLSTDTVFQYTTTSWIMWNFVLTVLSTGAKVVLYSGSPLYPNISFMLKIISQLRVTVFGTSAKYLTDLMDSKCRPRSEFDLSSLRKVTSTGSVLPIDVARWFYEDGFPKNIQLISGSGGTDCACAFVTSTPLLSTYADEIQAKALGMAVEVFDPEPASNGPKRISSDEPGELVCTQPFPSQPVTFYGPSGEEKYFKSYFSTFGPSAWVQGDLIRISPVTKGIQMLGRSDGVLNPSGVRFGSAEIYSVVRKFPEIEDSVCVGQRRPHDKDEAVLLFLRMKLGSKSSSLIEKVKKQIAQDLSKRHVPKYVFYVDDIPYSGVGKKLEIVVKNLVCGRKVESNVVANPESLAIFEPFFHVEEMARNSKEDMAKL